MGSNIVISGAGVITSCGVGKNSFLEGLAQGKSVVSEIESFTTEKFSVNQAAELKQFEPKDYLGLKGLRNLDRNAKFLLVAAKEALDSSKITINDNNTDDFGVCTGTTFSHFWSIVEFDREVFTSGLEFSNPALFPSTVLNAASSHVSIWFNIQGFNTTISTGYTSGLEALRYSLEALATDKAKTVLACGVDTLTFPLFFGFHKLGYMAGLKGELLSCPYDKRRNGPVLGEGAGVVVLESEQRAKSRQAKIQAQLLSVSSYFDGKQMGKINPSGEGLEKAIKQAVTQAKVDLKDIDYICSAANSSVDMDKLEVKVLKKVFGKTLAKIPVSSIKSMLGETFSAASSLQLIACIGAIEKGLVWPTINYKEKDPDCAIDCVANKAQKKNVKIALVVSFGPGGYNAAAILKKYA